MDLPPTTQPAQIQIAPDTQWYQLSQALLREGQVDEVRDRLRRACAPADPVWLMARVAALLTPYFDKETPQGIREIEAEDWAVSLERFPRWAIENACRWWKSEENPRRHRRPFEGDIAERIKAEMLLVNAVRENLSHKLEQRRVSHRPEPYAYDPKAEQDRKDRANDILKKAGFTPKRMGAAE